MIEDTMFFPKLRKHAKWMFLFLALVFGLGFIGFGVGAGGIGVGNVFQGVADSGVPSVSSAEKQVSENPRDPQAYRDLATAHQAEGNTDEAIEALEQLVSIRAKDRTALVDLATLYLVKAEEAQGLAQRADARAAFAAPGASVASILQLDGKPLDPDVISSTLNTRLSEAVNTALSEAQDANARAVDAYRRRAATAPRNPDFQLELAQTAELTGDSTTAIAAYEKFIVLVPEDPRVADVKQQLKALRPPVATTG